MHVRSRRVEVRKAVSSDAGAIADVHVRSWQIGYRGLLPDSYLAGLNAAERAARYVFWDGAPNQTPTCLVACEGSAIRGFSVVGPSRDGDTAGLGELMAMYVDPDHWRSGVGRMLIADARRCLAECGFTETILWVLAGNERASAFYRSDGWTADGAERQGAIWDVAVNELRYRRGLP